MQSRRAWRKQSGRVPPADSMWGRGWAPIETAPAASELLIYSGGRCLIATVVEGTGPHGPWRAFMDPRTDEIYPSPTHWMSLPEPPAAFPGTAAASSPH